MLDIIFISLLLIYFITIGLLPVWMELQSYIETRNLYYLHNYLRKSLSHIPPTGTSNDN